MANVLVIGGAGYIGSHMMKILTVAGHRAIAFDNLSMGHRESIKYGSLGQGDIADSSSLAALFDGGIKYDAVMHFALHIEVSESVENPQKYYLNNVSNTLNLLQGMRRAGCEKFIFLFGRSLRESYRNFSERKRPSRSNYSVRQVQSND